MPVANDAAGSLQELRYAKALTVDSVPEYVAYEPVNYAVYRETDPAQAVEGVNPDQFFEAAYSPVLQSMIAHVVNEEGPVLRSVGADGRLKGLFVQALQLPTPVRLGNQRRNGIRRICEWLERLLVAKL